MLGSVLVTGAAGRLGETIRRGLAGRVRELHLTDREPLGDAQPGERVSRGDLADLDFALEVIRDVDAVVHAAGIPDEAPFEDLVDANVRATYHVFEAARRNGVPRIVFASSAHVTGFYPRDTPIDETAPFRPDTLYGATKVFGEAVARLYADKHGLEVACLRIGSFRPRPETVRQLSTWLSPRDAVQLVERCLTAKDLGYAVVFGASANRRGWWTDRDGQRLGFAPKDDAEQYAPEVIDQVGPDGHDGAAAQMQGGVFAARDYHGGHG